MKVLFVTILLVLLSSVVYAENIELDVGECYTHEIETLHFSGIAPNICYAGMLTENIFSLKFDGNNSVNLYYPVSKRLILHQGIDRATMIKPIVVSPTSFVGEIIPN